MPWQFPDVRTVAGMVRTGLQRLANWLFGRLGSEESRIQFLQSHYPNASLQVLKRGLEQVRRGTQAAAEFTLGPNHPDLGSLPSDPTRAANGSYSYHVNIDVYGYQGGQTRGRPGHIDEVFHIFDTDQPFTKADLYQLVFDWVLGLQQPGRFGLAPLEMVNRVVRVEPVVISITRNR